MDDNIEKDEINTALKHARLALPERVIKKEEIAELLNSSKSLAQFSSLIRMIYLFHQRNPQKKKYPLLS